MADRLGPIPHDPSAPLGAWGWLVHSEPEVRARLLELARAHGWDANAIAAVIAFESGGDPSAQNPRSSATGLIQFMPATAAALGTSIRKIRSMSALGQLDLVERYFLGALAGHQPTEVADYYMATFMPAMGGMPDETEVGRRGMPVYDQNAGLDWNADGILDAGDVKQTFRRFFQTSRPSAAIDLAAPALAPPPHSSFGAAPSGKRSLIVLGVVGVAGLVWLFHRRAA